MPLQETQRLFFLVKSLLGNKMSPRPEECVLAGLQSCVSFRLLVETATTAPTPGGPDGAV